MCLRLVQSRKASAGEDSRTHPQIDQRTADNCTDKPDADGQKQEETGILDSADNKPPPLYFRHNFSFHFITTIVPYSSRITLCKSFSDT